MFSGQTLRGFSKIAQGAFSTLGSLRDEIDVIVNSRIEKILVSKGLVTKEEYDIAILRIDDLKMELEGIKLELKQYKMKNNKNK